MQVYRGTTTLTGTSSTVTLSTPVAVGESFVVASVKSQVDRPDSALPLVYLDTISGGNYTELKIERTRASAGVEDIVVAWQVLTGTEFTVQQGSATIGSGGTTTTATISAITTSRAFPIIYYNPSNANDGSENTAVNVSVNSTTQLGFARNTASTNTMSIRWQIIEWDNATVATYTDSIGSGASSKTTTITSVDTDRAFVIPYYTTSASLYGARALPRVRITNATTITASRGDTTNAISLRYFVVSHSQIIVKSGSVSMASGVASTTASPTPVRTDMTCLFTHIQGNGDQTSSSSASGRVLHILTDEDTFTFERTATSQTTTLNYQSVDFESVDETGTTALHIAEPIFFPNATNLGATGTNDLLEVAPVFFDTTTSVTNKKVFTNQQKGTKTWTNQQRYE
jgi:hypothetical protein